MTTTDALPQYGLIRPGMGDALVAIYRSHGDNAAAVWARLLTAANLRGDEISDAALHQMLVAMEGLDPITRLAARSLRVRVVTYAHLAAAQRNLAVTTH